MTLRDLKNIWKTQSERSILKSPVMEVVLRKCKSSEDDRPHDFYVIKSSDWCQIIPITKNGEVIMVKQYRVGISENTLEFPGGVADLKDGEILNTAIREMTEETGYAPVHGATTVSLGSCFPNPAILNNRIHYFAVGPVEKVSDQNLDHGEMIEVVRFPIDEIAARVKNGEISHALTLSALFYLGQTNPNGSPLWVRELERFSGPK
ncbi:MAG: NUDIX hydrolase [Bdellovibrionota bacterium]